MDQNSTFCLSTTVFLIKLLVVFCACFYKARYPSTNPLQEACFGFPMAAWDCKNCCQSFRKPEKKIHWRKSVNEREGKVEHKFDAASGKCLN